MFLKHGAHPRAGSSRVTEPRSRLQGCHCDGPKSDLSDIHPNTVLITDQKLNAKLRFAVRRADKQRNGSKTIC